jgi:hypothetical protein
MTLKRSETRTRKGAVKDFQKNRFGAALTRHNGVTSSDSWRSPSASVSLGRSVWNAFPAVTERLQVKFWRNTERACPGEIGGNPGVGKLMSLPKKDADLLPARGSARIERFRLTCRFAIEQYKQTRPFLTLCALLWNPLEPRDLTSSEISGI